MMMMMMNVEVLKRETIKPSKPTPDKLRTLELSLLDQVSPSFYVSIILFYPGNNVPETEAETARKSNKLIESLSKTLTRFYLLAGRDKDNQTIECDDSGVDYIETKVDCQLSKVFQNPEMDVLNQFVPLSKGVLLAIQINKFQCGGTGIGLSMSHKIGDASSLGTFINAWAATAQGDDETLCPSFDSAVLFPPRELSWSIPDRQTQKGKVVTRRFVFDSSKLADLKDKATEKSSVEKPTRVLTVCGLIWKCGMGVVNKNLQHSKPSMVNMVMNLRGRIVPPLPEHSFGNLIIGAMAESGEGHELHGWVGQLREAIRKIDGDYVRRLLDNDGLLRFHDSLKEAHEKFSKGDIELFTMSSWCRFPFYETDFGWGKPIWVAPANIFLKNGTLLMDTASGDGVEAWVSMDEHEMAELERDQEFCKSISAPQMN